LSGCRIETAVASSTPFPVKHITFDVKELPFEGQRLAYLVLTSTLQKAGLPTSQVWQKVSDRIEVKVESWMLPGHAVTILFISHFFGEGGRGHSHRHTRAVSERPDRRPPDPGALPRRGT
jgi:hypothetical protein